MPADRPKGPGRPPHQPTEETRALVVELVGQDKAVADIAIALGLSEPTVRAHYEVELAAPRPQINFPFAETASAAPPVARTAPSRAGRPEHVPTKKTRERVEILVAGGMLQRQIATALGISEPTLREHYAEHLDSGRSRKTAKVIEAMFKAATEGNVSAQKAFLAQHRELAEPEHLQQAKPGPLGKKDAANMAALTAGEDTEWAKLLPH